jgi:hypothetical protein
MTHFDLRSVTILQYSIIRGFYALVNIVSFQTHNLGTVSRARHKERQEADLKMQREARAEQNSLSFIYNTCEYNITNISTVSAHTLIQIKKQ